MFDVEADHESRLLKIVLRGFWTPETMRAYMRDVETELAKLQRTGGCKYILINMIDFALQSKEIAEGHAKNLHVVKRQGDVRVALVMQSALSKLQAQRVAHDTGHATFDNEASALAWLASDQN